MAKKKKEKNFAELEMEAYAKAEPDIHVDREKLILEIILKNRDEITSAKLAYLDKGNKEGYGRYGDIEAAFDILVEDLRKEGFDI